MRIQDTHSKAYKTLPFIPPEKLFLETDDQQDFEISEIYKIAALHLSIPQKTLEAQINRNFSIFIK